MLSQWQKSRVCAKDLASDAPHNGERKFSDWIAEHGPSFGKRYQNDLKEVQTIEFLNIREFVHKITNIYFNQWIMG